MEGRRLLDDRVSMFILFIRLFIIGFIMSSLRCVAQTGLPRDSWAVGDRGGVFAALYPRAGSPRAVKSTGQPRSTLAARQRRICGSMLYGSSGSLVGRRDADS